MNKIIKSLFIIFLILFLTGCASVISSNISDNADYSISFKDILKNPGQYKDKTIILGGEIIETNVKENRTTIIEIYQRPLGINDKPDVYSPSEGRFLILSDKYLDPYIYSKGRKITVGGHITGGEFRQIGEMNYFYPVVKSKEVYLWKESRDYDVIIIHDPWPWYYPHNKRRHIHDPLPLYMLKSKSDKKVNKNNQGLLIQ